MNRLEALGRGALAVALTLSIAGATSNAYVAHAAAQQDQNAATIEEQTSLQATYELAGAVRDEASKIAQEAAAAAADAVPTVGEQAVDLAKEQQGVSYVYGGASPSGFDCSGLMMYVYAQLGIELPHNAQAQYNACPSVSLDELEPGDLLFFGGGTSSISHVGMYAGDGLYIHSPRPGQSVTIADLSERTNLVAAARPSE